ncbi:hypothetical protein Y1Q_0013627 [Alligator mississippiensis]|uniref:Uncharacterized protein n=1 Tax=Alligator mississippiensis TaxID=8496 RepID=A0A151P3L6_ALLMI|nr:hypothetical protein Y1Q_0013627 [Alligator mississippiensis]
MQEGGGTTGICIQTGTLKISSASGDKDYTRLETLVIWSHSRIVTLEEGKVVSQTGKSYNLKGFKNQHGDTEKSKITCVTSKGDDTTEEEKKKSVVMGIQVVAGLSTEELSNATAGSKMWAMKQRHGFLLHSLSYSPPQERLLDVSRGQ